MLLIYKLERTNLTFCSVKQHKVVRFFTLIFIILSFNGVAEAQIAVQSRMHTTIGQEINEWPSGQYLDLSVHYWFRLKKYRVEFLPGLAYQHFLMNPDVNYSIGATIPVSFYPLDFVNDCDCPTFSKSSFLFQKGFFIRLTPAWSKGIGGSAPIPLDHLLETSISVGLDLGLSDFLTISPMIGYEMLHPLSVDVPSQNSIHFGISILFRHDYRRRSR